MWFIDLMKALLVTAVIGGALILGPIIALILAIVVIFLFVFAVMRDERDNP